MPVHQHVLNWLYSVLTSVSHLIAHAFCPLSIPIATNARCSLRNTMMLIAPTTMSPRPLHDILPSRLEPTSTVCHQDTTHPKLTDMGL